MDILYLSNRNHQNSLALFPFSQIVLLHRAYLTLLKGQKAKKTQRSYFLNSVYVNAVKTTRIGLSNNFNKPKSKIREWLWVVEMEESTGERCIKNKKRLAYHIFVCIALHQTQINSLVFDLATALKSMLTNYPIQIWLCVKPIRVKDCNKNKKNCHFVRCIYHFD